VGSKIVARAFMLTLLVAPVSAALVVACGSDRPPVGDTGFLTGGNYGEAGASDEGGGGGITFTILDAGAWCREVDGAATLVQDPESQCVCPSVNLNGINVILPCGYGFCVVGGQGAVCQPDETLVRHEDCPADGSFPADWLEPCVRDP
jgi:hypothetical protein